MATSLSNLPAPKRADTVAVTVVTNAAALEGLRRSWLDLLGRSDANGIMLTPMWLLPWWRVWGPIDGRQLRVVLFHVGERLVGLAPLLRRRHWHRGLVPLWRLEPLGSGERAGEQVCSDYLNVIAERGFEVLVAEGLAGAVAADRLGSWDQLLLPSMDGEGVMPGLLGEAFARQGARVAVSATDACPYVVLPATWDGYLKGLSSKRRYLINRSIRDFEKWSGANVSMHVAANADELAEGVRVLHVLHGERWRADGQGGVFSSPRVVAFHDAVLAEMLRAGALELVWVTVGGAPVSVQYNLVWDGKVSMYQSGRKIDVPKSVRPGLVLHAYCIRQAIAAGRREYDFLAGVSRYKMELASATRPLVQFHAVRAGLADACQRFLEAGVAWARAVRDLVPGRPARAPSPPAGDDSAKEGDA